jgi:hypothetical protein
MHKADLESVMLNQTPTVHSTRSNWYPVAAQVDKVKSHLIQSARYNIEELYDPNRFLSTAEPLECIDYLLADIKYYFPVPECVEGSVHGPNPNQRESKPDNELLASTVLAGRSNSVVYLHQILSSGE